MPCTLLSDISHRSYSIYLPGSYDADTLRRYPVLYLMHGGGESHTVWQRKGRLRELADSLIACGAMNDMVIVCPEANENNMMYFDAPQWKYESFFFREFVPYIERTYRVRTDKGGRAIAGFSMGGGAATVYGVHHPELFAMVYDISGYLRPQPLEWLKNDPSASWRQQVIGQNNPIEQLEKGSTAEVKAWKRVDWKVAVGDHDFTLEANMDLVKAFRRKGIDFSMRVGAGAHNWQWVAPALADAMQQASRNFQSLWISNGKRTIYGLLSRPAQVRGKQPVAIISHGFNGSHAFGCNYFDLFASMGYQCFTFDFPCGSVNSRSDDNTMDMSVLDEQSDLQAIVRYFQSQPDVDANRIVLVGESQGGLVSALTAAAMPKEVERLVLIYPALCIPDNWNERYPRGTEIPDTTFMWRVPLGKRYFQEVRPMKVYSLIGRYKRPVLIVHGDADKVVPISYSERARKTYKDARLHVIPKAGHGFKRNEFESCKQYISDFLAPKTSPK